MVCESENSVAGYKNLLAECINVSAGCRNSVAGRTNSLAGCRNLFALVGMLNSVGDIVGGRANYFLLPN